MRGGTNQQEMDAVKAEFQSTHPMRGGTYQPLDENADDFISIHPPHAGWDVNLAHIPEVIGISIHPPHAGWDSKRIQNCIPYLMHYIQFPGDSMGKAYVSSHPFLMSLLNSSVFLVRTSPGFCVSIRFATQTIRIPSA